MIDGQITGHRDGDGWTKRIVIVESGVDADAASKRASPQACHPVRQAGMVLARDGRGMEYAGGCVFTIVLKDRDISPRAQLPLPRLRLSAPALVFAR